MSRKIAIEPTPSAARRIIRLQAIMPSLIVDPEIQELALRGQIDMPDLPKELQDFAQDLTDFDLRLAVAMPPHWKRLSPNYWLDVIIRIAKERGVKDFVLVGDGDWLIHQCAAHCARMGVTGHVVDRGSFLDQCEDIPTNAMMIKTSYRSGDEDQLLHFERTIVVAEQIAASAIKLFPGLPTQRDVSGNRKLVSECSQATARELAPLMSISYAIMRYLPDA
jgi:hypothetical protein